MSRVDDGAYRMCSDCDGTGKSWIEWDGRCIYCRGAGEVFDSCLDPEED